MANIGNALRAGWKRREPVFWVVLIGFALTAQWPMLKGVFYRVTGATQAATPIKWETNPDSAVAAARRTRRLVLADFGASWCPPCVAMEHETWPDKKVADAVIAGFVPLKVDVDKNGDFAEKYQVSGIPALLLIDGEGRVVRRAEGYLPADGVLEFLKGQ